MSDLQLALVAAGLVLVAAVAVYNIVQERRARRRADAAFRSAHPDALLDPAAERREPVLGALPEETRQEPLLGSLDAVEEPARDAASGAAASAPGVLSSRVDTVALILADAPVGRGQLEPLLEALRANAASVHIEGLDGDQWMLVDDSPADSWRELRAGLQLASRAGPVAEEAIAAFNEAVDGFATSVGAVSQRESPAEAAARALELDHFCAETDIEVAVNVVGRAGATFGLARLKALALENGFAETGSGAFERRGADGAVAMTIRLADGDANRSAAYTTGLAFSFDVPHVADPIGAFAQMAGIAGEFARALGGELVDDARKPLGANGLAAIQRSLEPVVRGLEERGMPAGGALARRLFS